MNILDAMNERVSIAEKKLAAKIDGEYERLRKEGLNPIEAAYVMSAATGIVFMPPVDDTLKFLATSRTHESPPPTPPDTRI